MVKEYRKGAGVRLGTGLFTTAQFDCHCARAECQTTLVDELLVECLEIYWGVVGPFKIDSGFRCHAHNLEAGGAADSQHPKGTAADCKSKRGLTGTQMAEHAENIIPFFNGGIGTYPSFAHVDVRGHKARWSAVKIHAPC